MKKFIVVMLALFLAVPALSFAGSATSRFDLTVGGAINVDAAWSSQNAHEGAFGAVRASSATRKSLNDDNSNFIFSAADSAFNFRVKGPDVWGAKSSAFMQVNFRGVNSGNSFGGAQIHHAAMKFNWKSTELLIGKTFPEWGDVYGRLFIIGSDFGQFSPGGGGNTIKVSVRQWWGKNFNTMLGVEQGSEWQGAVRSTNDGYARWGLPYLAYEAAYETDACGVIGPNKLKFGLGGILGREKKSIQNGAVNNRWVDDDAPVWMTVLRGLVPIIPEKKGNKSNALYFTGNAFLGQNAQPGSNNWLATTGQNGAWYSNGSYWRPDAAGRTSTGTPTYFGGYLQLTYYITDATNVSAHYGYMKYNYSSWARQTAPVAAGMPANETDWKGLDRINMNQQYGLSIFHDPVPGIRLGFMWFRSFAHYNGASPGVAGDNAVGTGNLKSYGIEDRFKVGAIYFF